MLISPRQDNVQSQDSPLPKPDLGPGSWWAPHTFEVGLGRKVAGTDEKVNENGEKSWTYHFSMKMKENVERTSLDSHSFISASKGTTKGDPFIVNVFTMWSSSKTYQTNTITSVQTEYHI